MSSNLEEVTVQCNFKVVLELKEEGYHMFKAEKFMDKFLKISNPMNV